MTKAGLIAKLKTAYRGAAKGEKAVTVHLFGVKYADDLSEQGALAEIVRDAGLPLTYQTEVKKGMNLSRFVDVKRNVKL